MQLTDRWQSLLNAAVDGMIVIDARGTIEAFNPSAERIFGYAASEVVGRNVSVLMPPPDCDQHDRYIERYLMTGVRTVIGVGRDVQALRRDGSRFPAHLSVGEMRVANELHFVGIVHDLTARTQLEERIREQAALARIGEMAAVLAHEVRNPLAGIGGAIQVLGGRFPSGSPEREVVRDVLDRLQGLNELVQDLLLFARTPNPRLAPTELRRILSSARDLLAADPLFSGVCVTITGAAAPIEVDQELLRIVFQNLMINAAQAMEGRGTIAVSIEADHDRQRVVVADGGPGMTAETRAQLFKPFFTTKARGTGLGLATVRRLVEAHQGTVDVESSPGRGTRVIIDLPAVHAPADPTPVRASTSPA
jgi:PAS domain S-box-containing protein